MPFKKSQLGSKSKWGKAKTLSKVIAPWGNPTGQKTATGINGVGQGRARVTLRRGGRTVKRPDSSERAIANGSRMPTAWPQEDVGLAVSPTAYTPAEATSHNAIVNKAFQRGGYAG